FNVPIITTFNGMGCVATNHPLVFGALTRMGTTLASRVLKDADLVLAVGNSLNAVSTSRWQLDLPNLIQIDIDPAILGRYYGDRTLGIVGDGRETLDRLREVLQEDARETGEIGREAWIEDLQSDRDAWWKSTEPTEADEGSETLSPAAVVRVLRDASPDSTLLIP